MDYIQIKPELDKYIVNIRKQIRVSRALLYGSIAEGKSDSYSDVDLLIISDDFANIDIDDRAKMLYRKSAGFPYDLHVYGTTTSEYTNASPLTTLGQIRQSKTISV
jgi:uncharacterized protein